MYGKLKRMLPFVIIKMIFDGVTFVKLRFVTVSFTCIVTKSF